MVWFLPSSIASTSNMYSAPGLRRPSGTVNCVNVRRELEVEGHVGVVFDDDFIAPRSSVGRPNAEVVTGSQAMVTGSGTLLAHSAPLAGTGVISTGPAGRWCVNLKLPTCRLPSTSRALNV